MLELSDLPDDIRQSRVLELAQAEASRPFDLACDPMMRVNLLRLGERDYVLLFTLHHIAADGWSVRLLIDEFVTLYTAFDNGSDNPLPPLAIQYADHAYYQRQALTADLLQPQLDYWHRYLAGAPQQHSLPLDRERSERRDATGRMYFQQMPASLSKEIQALARTHDATLFMALQAAFALLLARWSHETDIVMSVPVAGRTHRQTEKLIGLFVNTLLFRSTIDPASSFSHLLAMTKANALAAFANQDIPFEQLVDSLQPERRLNCEPLSQIVFSLQDNERAAFRLPFIDIEPLEQEVAPIKYDLELTVDGQRASYLALAELADELCEGRWVSTGGGGYSITNVVPRAWTHLLAIVGGQPLAPETPTPQRWRAELGVSYVPMAMTDGVEVSYTDFESGFSPTSRLDQAILATRKAVFPELGLDPGP